MYHAVENLALADLRLGGMLAQGRSDLGVEVNADTLVPFHASDVPPAATASGWSAWLRGRDDDQP